MNQLKQKMWKKHLAFKELVSWLDLNLDFSRDFWLDSFLDILLYLQLDLTDNQMPMSMLQLPEPHANSRAVAMVAVGNRRQQNKTAERDKRERWQREMVEIATE